MYRRSVLEYAKEVAALATCPKRVALEKRLSLVTCLWPFGIYLCLRAAACFARAASTPCIFKRFMAMLRVWGSTYFLGLTGGLGAGSVASAGCAKDSFKTEAAFSSS